MTFQNINQAYTNNTGTTPTNWPVFYDRDPTPNDIYYTLGKFWVNNGPIKKLWYLAAQSNVITPSNPTGAIQSDWELISANPPLVITFTGDTGSATPAGSILNIFGNDTTANNDNGITTTASGNTVTVLLTNRIQGSATTIGAVSANVISFSPPVIGTYSIECRIAGYNTTSALGAGYSLFGAIRFDGVSTHLTGTVDKVVNEEGTMSSANVNMTVAAGAVNIVVTGYLGQTINWSAVALYTFAGV